MTEMMDIGRIPPSVLYSLHAQPMKWAVAMGELCDNSFDAAATRIVIRFPSKANVEVIDDGLVGCVDFYGNVVYLNPSHERLAHHKRQQNTDALVDFCMPLLVHEYLDKRERARGVFPQLRDYGSFVEAWSAVSAATVSESNHKSIPETTEQK